ncbi:MAG: histone deacetylase, partial [Phycisphaeraceae bacterium]
VDQVSAGHVRNAFCAVRPPGHHAEHDRSMGFCIFNNVAIAAEHLIREHGLERVAIIDFDVHHGNGTQHIFEDRADVLYISIHEHPQHLYPGTGFASETGRGPGEGTTINLPVLPGAGDDVYRRLFRQRVIPALDDFSPQVLLISAGFDACKDDPLAHVELSAEGFGWMTQQLRDAAERHCGGRLISMLEGGYDLRSLAECVAVHVGGLLGDAQHDHRGPGV